MPKLPSLLTTLRAATLSPIVLSIMVAGGGPAAAAHRKHPDAAAVPAAPKAAINTNPNITHPTFGSYCMTPLGRLGPGFVQPLGAPCTGKASSGAVSGQTVE